MPNYFEHNKPAVVGVPIAADALTGLFGAQAVREVEVAFRREDLEEKTGLSDDPSTPGNEIHWVEYRLKNTQHVKRVERSLPKGWEPPKPAPK